jgi:hypothetical protein
MIEREDTGYGEKITGLTRFVFVAPHGGPGPNDDAHTADIAEKLAFLSDSSAVINRNFVAARTGEEGVDKNNVSLADGTEFIRDLDEIVNEQLKSRGSVTVVTLHGSANNLPPFRNPQYTRKKLYNGEWLRVGETRPYDIDIGCGLTEDFKYELEGDSPRGALEWRKRFPLARQVKPERGNGARRIARPVVYKFKKALERLGYTATIGLEWAAQSPDNLVQYFAGKGNVSSMQLEIIKGHREYVDRISKDVLTAVLIAYSYHL